MFLNMDSEVAMMHLEMWGGLAVMIGCWICLAISRYREVKQRRADGRMAPDDPRTWLTWDEWNDPPPRAKKVQAVPDTERPLRRPTRDVGSADDRHHRCPPRTDHLRPTYRHPMSPLRGRMPLKLRPPEAVSSGRIRQA